MSDRKESLLRTLKLQNEQLEQWEHKRTIARDPDEERLCNDKIEDIKKLMLQNEAELKKIKGGKLPNNQQVAFTTPKGLKPVEYPRIGFNADKEYIKGETNDGISANNSYTKVGDDFNSEEIKINDPVIATIKSEGNYERVESSYGQYVETADENIENRKVTISTTNTTSFQLKENMSVFFAIGLAVMVFILTLIFDDSHVASKILGGIITIAGIVFVYWNPYKFSARQGLKFSVSILALCVYASIFLWEKQINFGKEANKAVGDAVILPLLLVAIGSIVVLINEENKKKNK